jgi:hypothetical protein
MEGKVIYVGEGREVCVAARMWIMGYVLHRVFTPRRVGEGASTSVRISYFFVMGSGTLPGLASKEAARL